MITWALALPLEQTLKCGVGNFYLNVFSFSVPSFLSFIALRTKDTDHQKDYDVRKKYVKGM